MNFGNTDLFFNLLVLGFWFPIWLRAQDRLLFFNAHLALLNRLPAFVLRLVHPALPRLPERAVLGIIIIVLLILHAQTAPAGFWSLGFGFSTLQLPVQTGLGASLTISLLSFAAFLFRLWAISTLYLALAAGRADEQYLPPRSAAAALSAIAAPFTRLPAAWRPAALFAFGLTVCMLAVYALDAHVATVGLATGASAVAPTPTTAGIVKCALMTLSGWTDILLVVQQAMIFLIIGSLVATLTGSMTLMMLFREWIDLLLGPLRHYPFRIGMLDLTPWLFLFLVYYIHVFINGLLLSSFYRWT